MFLSSSLSSVSISAIFCYIPQSQHIQGHPTFPGMVTSPAPLTARHCSFNMSKGTTKKCGCPQCVTHHGWHLPRKPICSQPVWSFTIALTPKFFPIWAPATDAICWPCTRNMKKKFSSSTLAWIPAIKMVTWLYFPLPYVGKNMNGLFWSHLKFNMKLKEKNSGHRSLHLTLKHICLILSQPGSLLKEDMEQKQNDPERPCLPAFLTAEFWECARKLPSSIGLHLPAFSSVHLALGWCYSLYLDVFLKTCAVTGSTFGRWLDYSGF